MQLPPPPPPRLSWSESVGAPTKNLIWISCLMPPLQREWKKTPHYHKGKMSFRRLPQHRSHAMLVKELLKQQSKMQWLLLASACAFSGSFWVTDQSWFANLLTFIRKGVTLGGRWGPRKHQAEEGEKGAWDWNKKRKRRNVWENNFLSFRMSPSHRNAHWHFAGRAANPAEMPQGIAPRLTSRKHRARLTSQTKNIMFISGECWQPKHVTNGRVCKIVPCPLNPSRFLDRKKKSVVLLVVGFLSCDKFPADPGTFPIGLLPARGPCWFSGNILSSSDSQGVGCQWPLCHPWGCPLWSAGCWGSCSSHGGTLLFKFTVCLGIGQWLGSYLKVTFNKKQVKILCK